MDKIANTKPIIEIAGLRTMFGKQVIHDNLDLNIYQREILAIVGASGSGKTTLLRAILMLQPFTGTIKISGQNIQKIDEKERHELRQRWGVMFQGGALFSSLTVLENIAFPLREYTQLSYDEIREICKLKVLLVGLSLDALDKYPAELSGGMQKRVAVARAISLDPELLFLDEPSSGLDPKGASGLDELILYLRDALGLTVVVVTHDVDTLWSVADRVAFLGQKKVLQVGPIEELYQSKVPAIIDYFNDPRSQLAKNIKEVKKKQEQIDYGN